jgi:hypothetical protein
MERFREDFFSSSGFLSFGLLKGDHSKLLKDVQFALRGRIAELVVGRLQEKHHHSNNSVVFGDNLSWSQDLCSKLAATVGRKTKESSSSRLLTNVLEQNQSFDNALELSSKIGAGDEALTRFFFFPLVCCGESLFCLTQQT